MKSCSVKARSCLEVAPSAKQAATPRRIEFKALRTHDTETIDPNTVNAERRRIESGATTRQVVDSVLWSPTHLARIKQ